MSSASRESSSWRTIVPSREVLESWCSTHNIHHPSVHHTSIPGCGNGLVASQAIPAGVPFVTVPTSAILTERVTRESVIGQCVEEWNRKLKEEKVKNNTNSAKSHAISPRTCYYLYLIYTRWCSSTPSHLWFVHGVPREYSTPLTWTEDELKFLQGTNLGEAVPHRMKQLRARFMNAQSMMRANRHLFPEEENTFEAFVWAHDTYCSRGFPAQLADPTLAPARPINPNVEQVASLGPNIQSSAATSTAASSSTALASSASSGPIAPTSHLGCLIPYIDLTNHRYRHPITWTYHPASASSSASSVSSSSAHVSFSCNISIPSGSEVLNNYGAKTNEEWLMAYGFTERDNPHDEVTVVLGERALTQQKRALVMKYGLKLNHYLQRLSSISTKHTTKSIPSQLLQLLRVSVMSEEEMQRCSQEWISTCALEYVSADSSSLSSSTSSPPPPPPPSQFSLDFISSHNELTMLYSLRTLLYGRLKRLAHEPEKVEMEWILKSSVHGEEKKQTNEEEEEHKQQATKIPRTTSASKSTTSSSVSSSPSSPSYQLHLLTSSSFSHDTHLNRTLLESNSTSFLPSPNYHLECALNYKMGQREVLMDAMREVDERIRDVVNRSASSSVQVFSLAAAPVASESTSSLSSSKKRKKNDSSSTSSMSSLLPAYTKWITQQGANIVGDWTSSSNEWKITTDSGVSSSQSVDGNHTILPTFFRAPLDTLLRLQSFSETPLGEVESLNDLDECFQLVLLLLHERSKGEESVHQAWIDLVWNRVYTFDGSERDDFVLTTGSAGEELSSLFDDVFTPLTHEDIEPVIYTSEYASWNAFLHAVCIVHEYCIEVPSLAQPGEYTRVLLPVPLPPHRCDRHTVPSAMAREVKDSNSDQVHLVVHSITSMPSSSSIVTLSSSSFPSRLLPYCNTLLLTDSIEFPLSNFLVMYQESIETGGEMNTFCRPFSTDMDRIMKQWEKIGVDESSVFHLTANESISPLLLASLQAFFEPLPRTTSTSSLPLAPLSSGTRADDSDEEDEEETEQQEKRDESMEAEEKEAEESQVSSSFSTREGSSSEFKKEERNLLEATFDLFSTVLRVTEGGDDEEEKDEENASSLPSSSTTASKDQLHALYTRHRQRIVQAVCAECKKKVDE